MSIEIDRVERARPPGTAVLVSRGIGWGAVLGLIAGFVLPSATELAVERRMPAIVASVLLGFLTAPVGMVFGVVAGGITALCCVPIAGRRWGGAATRVVAAIVAPIVVVLLSLAVFRPSFAIGPNQNSDHRLETALLFVALPAFSALLAGAVFGSRLTSPASPEPDRPLTRA